jgi:hypothetical protein
MDISNLMENVRAFFSEQYKGVENSNSFISFEPLGSMIDPADFKDDSGLISDIKATEQLSVLGDRLPRIEQVFIPDLGRLSSNYETLIESAVFSGAKIKVADKSSYISRFNAEKSEALQKFEEGKKASILMPQGSYLPVYSYPEKWYDSMGSFWVNKTFSSNDNSTTVTVTSDPPPPGRKPFLGWRKRLPDIAPEDDVAVLPGRLPRNNAEGMIRPIRPVVMPDGTAQHLNRLPLADRLDATRELVNNDTTNVTSVQSNAFSMSFDYCLVYLERPWFNTSLFSYANLWYNLSLQENYFSNGVKDASNKGILKCFSTAMIFIKNLKITAAWTEQDKTNALNSIGLGVFNLNNSQFINNELTTPGMQIIGWMCEILPKLPVQGDPNFIS